MVLEWADDQTALTAQATRTARVGLYIPIKNNQFDPSTATTRMNAAGFYRGGDTNAHRIMVAYQKYEGKEQRGQKVAASTILKISKSEKLECCSALWSLLLQRLFLPSFKVAVRVTGVIRKGSLSNCPTNSCILFQPIRAAQHTIQSGEKTNF